MDSVETDHAGGGVPDSPTVCASSHDANDDRDTLCEDEDEVEQFPTLSDRVTAVQRVVDEIKLSALVKRLVEHSRRGSCHNFPPYSNCLYSLFLTN